MGNPQILRVEKFSSSRKVFPICFCLISVQKGDMALVLRVRTLFRGTRDSDDVSPNSMSQQLWVEDLGMPPELLQSAASETEAIICLRGRAQSQRKHPRWDSVVEEPSSTSTPVQEENSLPSRAVDQPAEKPAPNTH